MNTLGGKEGFILNEFGQAELWEFGDAERTYYTDDEYSSSTDIETEYFYDRPGVIKKWGLTLDKYYPHPYYPDQEIIAFKCIRSIPNFMKDDIMNVMYIVQHRTNGIFIRDGYYFSNEHCLQYPEYFKPLYVKQLTKKDLLELKVNDKVLIALYDNQKVEHTLVSISKNAKSNVSLKFTFPSTKHTKFIDNKGFTHFRSKPGIGIFNLVIGKGVNAKGEQRLYSDSAPGICGIRKFFKIDKN